MCELFALSSNRPVNIKFTWRGFRLRGQDHPHGWGLAWYINKRMAGMVKEPRPSPSSPISKLMIHGVRSHIVISHVRYASRGERSYVNTHPFIRRLHGRDWVFAHNGVIHTIVDDPEFELEWCHPAGVTDSEHAFCYMLEKINSLGENPGLDKLAHLIWEMAKRIGEHGKFNFLMSNGTLLFVYMNMEYTLHYLLRRPPFRGGPVSLIDEDFSVDLKTLKSPDERAAIIATLPLTDEDWIPMEPEVLYVFRDGEIIRKIG